MTKPIKPRNLENAISANDFGAFLALANKAPLQNSHMLLALKNIPHVISEEKHRIIDDRIIKKINELNRELIKELGVEILDLKNNNALYYLMHNPDFPHKHLMISAKYKEDFPQNNLWDSSIKPANLQTIKDLIEIMSAEERKNLENSLPAFNHYIKIHYSHEREKAMKDFATELVSILELQHRNGQPHETIIQTFLKGMKLISKTGKLESDIENKAEDFIKELMQGAEHKENLVTKLINYIRELFCISPITNTTRWREIEVQNSMNIEVKVPDQTLKTADGQSIIFITEKRRFHDYTNLFDQQPQQPIYSPNTTQPQLNRNQPTKG